MALWSYSDWITQTTDAARLERLRLHIQEVSEHVMSSETPNVVKIGAVSDEYVRGLRAEEQRLTARAEAAARAAAGRNVGRNRVSFRNWQ